MEPTSNFTHKFCACRKYGVIHMHSNKCLERLFYDMPKSLKYGPKISQIC